MNRNYRYKLKELKEKPSDIHGIYIIPYKAYNGFWGKNGYKSFDFIFENIVGDKVGWCHWEGDVINFKCDNDYDLNMDCNIKDDYIRLFSRKKLSISDMLISNIVIGVGE
jgi:hypothetical protein